MPTFAPLGQTKDKTMTRKTLLLMLAAFLLISAGVCRAQEENSEPEAGLSATSIVVKGSALSVYNASGSILEIFSLTGTKVAAIRIDSNEKTVILSLKKGCYILKVNEVVRKISIH